MFNTKELISFQEDLLHPDRDCSSSVVTQYRAVTMGFYSLSSREVVQQRTNVRSALVTTIEACKSTELLLSLFFCVIITLLDDNKISAALQSRTIRFVSLLAMIAISAVQSFTRTFFHNAILFILDTSNNP